MPSAPQAKLTVVAEFSEHFFLENLAVRADGSMLITVANRKELWFVPVPGDALPVKPVLLDTFEFNVLFVVEWKPERFLLAVADVYDTHESRLYELDLTGSTAAASSRRTCCLRPAWQTLSGGSTSATARARARRHASGSSTTI